MFEEREIYRAIAEVAYAIARAGDGMQSEERQEFYSIIKRELDYKSWMAESRFDLLDEMHMDPSNAFDYAISELKKYRNFVTPEMKEKALNVANAVALAYHGKNPMENDYLTQLQEAFEI